MEWIGLLILGLLAGGLSTITGVGGGALGVATLTAFFGPHLALAVTAPALLVGNLHRIWLFRSQFFGEKGEPKTHQQKVWAFMLGAAPFALLSSLWVASFPEWLLGLLIVLASGLFALRKLVGDRVRLPARFMGVLGAVAGGVTATSGGGGVIVAPVMLAVGLRGGGYIVACSLAATSIHLMRVPGYFIGGILDASTLVLSFALALGLTFGNTGGRKLRGLAGERVTERLTYLVLTLLIVLALSGFVLSLF